MTARAILAAALLAGLCNGPALAAEPMRLQADVPSAGAPQEVRVEPRAIPASGGTGWHIHHGVEMSVVVRGAVEVTVQGAAPRLYHPGEGFQIPRDTPHLAVNAGPDEAGLVVTYLMDKGAPVKIPVPAPDAPAPK